MIEHVNAIIDTIYTYIWFVGIEGGSCGIEVACRSFGLGRASMFVDGRGECIGAYEKNMEAVGKPSQRKGQVGKRHMAEHGTYAACRAGGARNLGPCVLALLFFNVLQNWNELDRNGQDVFS